MPAALKRNGERPRYGLRGGKRSVSKVTGTKSRVPRNKNARTVGSMQEVGSSREASEHLRSRFVSSLLLDTIAPNRSRPRNPTIRDRHPVPPSFLEDSPKSGIPRRSYRSRRIIESVRTYWVGASGRTRLDATESGCSPESCEPRRSKRLSQSSASYARYRPGGRRGFDPGRPWTGSLLGASPSCGLD